VKKTYFVQFVIDAFTAATFLAEIIKMKKRYFNSF